MSMDEHGSLQNALTIPGTGDCLFAFLRFGLSSKLCRTSLDLLLPRSLPCPALALFFPDVLQTNFRLLDQRFSKGAASKRILAVDSV